MKDNANLVEKLKDAEYQNILLEGETDTIGGNVCWLREWCFCLNKQFY